MLMTRGTCPHLAMTYRLTLGGRSAEGSNFNVVICGKWGIECTDWFIPPPTQGNGYHTLNYWLLFTSVCGNIQNHDFNGCIRSPWQDARLSPWAYKASKPHTAVDISTLIYICLDMRDHLIGHRMQSWFWISPQRVYEWLSHTDPTLVYIAILFG